MSISEQYQTELLQERFALKIAARLTDASEGVGHDIAERLRFARSQALAKRKPSAPPAAPLVLGGGAAATLGAVDEGWSWWSRIGAVLPLLALVLGLVLINSVQSDRVVREVASVDAALLIDDLPPAAYADPGFSQFLKINQTQTQ